MSHRDLSIGDVGFVILTSEWSADYILQTHHQAETKGKPGRDGQWACFKHVATLTATTAIALTGTAAWTGKRLGWRRVAAGLAFNAATHYLLDRREPLRKFCDRLSWMGKDEFYRSGDGLATGAHYLDRAAHIGSDLIAAALVAGRGAPS